MDDKKLEKLLCEIFEEEILPSEALVQKTKCMEKSVGSLDKLIGISVLLNFAVLAGIVLTIVFSGYSLLIKGVLLTILSGALNVISLLPLIFRDKITTFFNRSLFFEKGSYSEGGLQ